MNLRHIAAVAASVAWFGEEPNRHRSLKETQKLAITEYWKSSRFLVRRWETQLQRIRSSANSVLSLPTLAREIVISELLTRCVAGRLFVFAETFRTEELSNIAQKSIEEHLRLQQAVSLEMELQPDLMAEQLRNERLQRKIGRWSDLLLSGSLQSDAALRASVDVERCLDFNSEFSESAEVENRVLTAQLQMSSLMFCVPNQPVTDEINSRSHYVRCEAALNCQELCESAVKELPNSQIRRMILTGQLTDSNVAFGHRLMNHF